MNTLEFEKFGVQGLDAKEMVEVDGGWIPFIIAGAALVVEVVAYAAAGDLILDFDHYRRIGEQAAADGKAAAQQ